MRCTFERKIGALVLSGLSLATVGLVMFITLPQIMDKEIKKRLVIQEDSPTYKYWKDVPVPIYLHFYFFNITNINEIWEHKHKPILEELGPYTFRESREKVDVVFNDNGTVSYRQVKKWYFQKDRTNGSLDDVITTLNVPMVAAAMRGKIMNDGFVFFALQEIFDSLNCSWFIKKPVQELLFDGYDDPLMTLAKNFMNIPYDKFGWFYKRNDTDDGEIVAHTGSSDINVVDEIYSWNGLQHVSAYDPPCNMINGSAGDMWPPNQSRNHQITLFVTDICRSLSFEYLEDTEMDGITAYRFWANDQQLDNGKNDPENACFCSEDICLPPGGLNVSSCKFDAPAVVSYPHFLYADTKYTEGVEGMHPDPKLHRMYLDVIPEMGIPIEVAARMQINIIFEGVPNITQFANITERIYFPILWFSETAEAGQDILSQLKLALVTVPIIGNVFSFLMVATGSFLLLSAFILSILHFIRKENPPYSNVSSKTS